MENYNSFQEIIDAFKAEYVNARNLKKSVNSKKRTARNAASLKSRKENELSTLETKKSSVESSLDSALSIAIDGLESAKHTDLNKKLADLKSSLAIIDAEVERLIELVNINPDEYDTWTPSQQQSIQLVRNMLMTSIYEAEQAIANLYTGIDYNSIKQSTVPNQITDGYEEVFQHYNSLKSSFNDILGELQNAVVDYTENAFSISYEIRQKNEQLIYDSKNLVDLKSDLADMLSNEATQSEIDEKELEIENHKEYMRSKLILVKELRDKFVNLIELRYPSITNLAENLEDIYEEVREYQQQNVEITRYMNPINFDKEAGVSVSEVFDTLFYLIGNHSEDLSDSSALKDSLQNMRDIRQDFAAADGEGFRQDFFLKEHITSSEIMMFTTDENGKKMFKPELHPEMIDQYIDVTTNIVDVTSEYIRTKAEIDAHRINLNNGLWKFNDPITNKFFGYAGDYKSALTRHLLVLNNSLRYTEGVYTGTPEQEELLNVLYNTKVTKEGQLADKQSQITMMSNKLDIYNDLFYQTFYQTYDSLKSTKDSTTATYLDLQPQLDLLNTAVGEAYNLLVTSSEPTEGYVYNEDNSFYVLDNADYATFLAADAALQSFKDDVNNPAYDAKNAAEAAFDAHLNASYTIHDTITCDGNFLKDVKEAYPIGLSELSVLETELNDTNNELSVLKSEMTFVPRSNKDERDAVEAESRSNTTYQLKQLSLEILNEYNTKAITSIKEQITAANQSLNYYAESNMLETYLNSVISFMNNQDSNRQNQLYTAIRNSQVMQADRRFRDFELYANRESACDLVGMNDLADKNNNLIEFLKTSSYKYGLRNYIEQFVIPYSGILVWRIENELDNGQF
jgi:hypothetical protein